MAKKILGWQPTVERREGLLRTIDYFRSSDCAFMAPAAAGARIDCPPAASESSSTAAGFAEAKVLPTPKCSFDRRPDNAGLDESPAAYSNPALRSPGLPAAKLRRRVMNDDRAGRGERVVADRLTTAATGQRHNSDVDDDDPRRNPQTPAGAALMLRSHGDRGQGVRCQVRVWLSASSASNSSTPNFCLG